MTSSLALWSVGHSNHAFDKFARLLAGERIGFVADVRSYPYSRFAPQFNREDVQVALRTRGVRYVFFGDELGGRPSRDDQYDSEGHALYGTMAQDPQFLEAIDRLLSGAAEHRIALLCSEGNPKDCHRRLLVGRVLTERGVELRHILPNGKVSSERSVVLGGDEQGALFGENVQQWRSTQSVSHRRRLSGSSVG